MDIMIIVYAVLSYLIGSIPSGVSFSLIQTYDNMALKILALLIHIELSDLKQPYLYFYVML